MATLTDLAHLLEQRLERTPLDTTEVQKAFLAAARREVPKRTRALERSLRVSPGTLHGTSAQFLVSMRRYGTFVQKGHAIVAWGHPTGRRQPPNPFLTRAADAPEVRAALRVAILRLLRG